MKIAEGLEYHTERWRDSDCYILKVDLSKRSIRPVMVKEQFPFRTQEHPEYKAIEQGALACVTDEFNIVTWNNQGVTDQPQHALVIDREIWTTGIASGGYGFHIADGYATTAKNMIQIHVWRPDKSSVRVEHINLSHDGKCVAFTGRGGTNDVPLAGKHYAMLVPIGDWEDHFDIQTRKMQVSAPVEPFVVPAPPDDGEWICLEGRWPLKLAEGDVVNWRQSIGAPGVHTIISGWPEILHNGENTVHGIFGIPSHGPDNWFARKNPRTALGTTQDGKTAVIIVVQGRTPNSYRPDDHSRGLRVKELGTLLKQHGAHYAVNIDGGGSAYLWLRDGGSDHGGTVVAPGCYNKPGTLAGSRPVHFTTSIF